MARFDEVKAMPRETARPGAGAPPARARRARRLDHVDVPAQRLVEGDAADLACDIARRARNARLLDRIEISGAAGSVLPAGERDRVAEVVAEEILG